MATQRVFLSYSSPYEGFLCLLNKFWVLWPASAFLWPDPAASFTAARPLQRMCIHKWKLLAWKMPGQIPPFALLPSWKYILVTSSHHVVCLQCLSLPSWAACMFVFGFVADSLAAATAGPLLGQFSDWKCWRLENLTEEVVAGGKWPLYSSFGCAFIFAVLEPLQSACPPLTPAVVF